MDNTCLVHADTRFCIGRIVGVCLCIYKMYIIHWLTRETTRDNDGLNAPAALKRMTMINGWLCGNWRWFEENEKEKINSC